MSSLTATDGTRATGFRGDGTLASAWGPSAIEPSPGQRLGGADGARFELRERLGGGGMAVVFLAHDRVLDRKVAIKFLTNEAVSTTESFHRIQLEAQACARLSHENLVRLFDIGTDKGLPFLVMEYLEGSPLDVIVRDEGVDARRAVRIMIDVARGLSQAHRAGIVHRDLKPSNVFVTKDGPVKILDFGVATMTARPDAAQEGLSGTPRYMSPEQWKGEAQDGRTDIWAAGVMFFELLTGHAPFVGASISELRDAVVSAEPAPLLRSARPDLSEEAERITQRAMSKKVGDRIGTADELLDSLVALGLALTHATRIKYEASEHPPRPKPERRQTTVLSCSLFDVPELPGEQGLDEFGELLDNVFDVCATVIRQLEGTLLSSLGPRVVACFGYPIAHEDNAQRAMRAASLIVEAIRGYTRPDGRPHAARIGIDTSLSIASRAGRASASLMIQGDAPHVAQWLERRAGPNEILIGSVTQMLVRSTFELEPLTDAVPDGGKRPMRSYRVIGPKEAPLRFDPVAGGALTPLVGRDRELDELRALWDSTKAGLGRFVLLIGEAGIGKSRLLERHLDQIANEPHAIVRCQCWPHFQNSALQPIVEGLLGKIGLRQEVPGKEKIDRLEAALGAIDFASRDRVQLFAAFFGIPTGDRYPPLLLSPDLFKKRILDVLVSLFVHLANRRPLILIVEDAHWSDGSTLELLDRLLADMVTTSLTVIVTARTEFQPPWPQRSHLHRLALERLSPDQTGAMIAFASRGRHLPSSIVEQLVNRTDGVPLFIEELTHRVADALHETKQHGGDMAAESFASKIIPASLDALLHARLDALPHEGQDVAHLVAVLGRDATYDLIQQTSELPEAALRIGLMHLLETGIIRQHGQGSEARYTFSHALVKEAAYQSLVKSKRMHLHRRVADVLVERFQDFVDQNPELVAGHFMEAGSREHAVSYFEKAGQRALQRSATLDAATHYSSAIAQLRMLAESPIRDQRELAMQLAFSAALFAGEVIVPADFARQLIAKADLSRDPAMMLLAQGTFGLSSLIVGDFITCRDQAAAALAVYESQEHGKLAPGFRVDPGVHSGICLLWAIGLLGDSDRAMEYGRKAVQQARRSGHPFSRTLSLLHLAMWYNFRGEFDEGRRLADEAAPICEKEGLEAQLTITKFVRGWSRWGTGDRAGSRELEEGVIGRTKVGPKGGLTLCFAVLANAQLEGGSLDNASRTVEHAMSIVERKGERFFEAELLRVRGEILLATGNPPSLAFECFERGLEVARRQQARAWELRLAHSYARALAKLSRRGEARALLAPVVAHFVGRRSVGDVREARALLAVL